MGRVKCRWTLCCSPEPLARLWRLFPKLALFFLVLHVCIMIYSVTKPYPKKSEDAPPPGVVDPKMMSPVLKHVNHELRHKMGNLTSNNNSTDVKKRGPNDSGQFHHNPKLGLMQKLGKMQQADQDKSPHRF